MQHLKNSQVMMEELTQLPFGDLKLHGREKELEQLQVIQSRMMLEGSSEMVLVGGYSGVGKSALIEAFSNKILLHNTSSNSDNNSNSYICPSVQPQETKSEWHPEQQQPLQEDGYESKIHDTIPNNNDSSKKKDTSATQTTSPTTTLLMGEGKFTMAASGGQDYQPYAALSDALNQLSRMVCTVLDSKQQQEIGTKVRTIIGRQGAKLLFDLIPQSEGIPGLDDGTHQPSNASLASSSASASVTSVVSGSLQVIASNGSAGDEGTGPVTNTTGTDSTITGAVTSTSSLSVVAKSTEEALNRLKFVIKTFVREVATAQHPVIVFLDDLQWVDEASLELIKGVCVNVKQNYFMFVGSYRENELPDAASKQLQQMEEMHQDTSCRIHIQNLGQDVVHTIVTDLLKSSSFMEDDLLETKELTQIIYEKTHGNSFFVLQFVRMLRDEDLLSYSLQNFTWEWNVETIRTQTNSSDNVVDLVLAKMKLLSPELQTILQMAAMWSTIQINVLHSILLAVPPPSNNEENSGTPLAIKVEEIVRRLDEAEIEGLVVLVDQSAGRYRFAHDRIQESAYALAPEGRQRELLHFRIGEHLLQLRSHPETAKGWMLFGAADQLNLGVACVDEAPISRVELAHLNLEAGERAVSLSAFAQAASYVQSGIQHIGGVSDKWTEHYNLSLRLHTVAAEMSAYRGDLEMNQKMADAVSANARCLEDKLRVNFTLVDSLGAQERTKEGMKLAYSILKDLGENFPKKINVFHVVMHLVKTKRMLQKKTDQDLMNLPKMENVNKIAAMKLLISITKHGFMLQQPNHVAMVIFRMVQLSLRYGVDNLSPSGFSSYGLVLCSLGEFKEGYRFGQLALNLLKNLKANEWEAQVLCVTAQFLNHWQEPLHAISDLLVKAHDVGMQYGDVEYAQMSACGYCMSYFYSGLHLAPLLKDSKSYCDEMVEYKQITTLQALLPYRQAVLNLMGNSEDPVELTGEAMNQEDFLQKNAETDNIACIQIVWIIRAQLAYYFKQTELAQEQLELFGKSFDLKAHPHFCYYTYFSGLVAVELARRSPKKSRKFKSRAKKAIQQMSKWSAIGAVNYIHRLLLLKADYAALSVTVNDGEEGSYKIQRMFDDAISASAKTGFLQDAALANERAGIFFKGVDDDLYRATQYFTKAYQLYIEWGATAKARHLERQFALNTRREHRSSSASSNASSGSNIRGRARFSNRRASGNLMEDQLASGTF